MRCCRNIEFKPNLKSFLQFKSTAKYMHLEHLFGGALFYVRFLYI